MNRNLSTLELHISLAIAALRPFAYGVSIQDHIKKCTGIEHSAGAIYAAVGRLKKQGFVERRHGEKTAAKGGKRKLYFTLTKSGNQLLRRSLRELDNMRKALTGPAPKLSAAK